MEKICGIYKITSPSGRIYIGKSIDILRRFSSYRSLNCKSQRKLYASLCKYTPERHVFEVIELCSVDIIIERERHWQEHFDVLNIGLNCLLSKTSNTQMVLSQETKNKISKSLKGKRLGIKMSPENVEKIRQRMIGRKPSDITRKKMSDARIGKPLSDLTKRNMSTRFKGRKYPNWVKEKRSKKLKGKSIEYFKVKILLNNQILFGSITEASIATNTSRSTISNNLTGRSKSTKIGIWTYQNKM